MCSFNLQSGDTHLSCTDIMYAFVLCLHANNHFLYTQVNNVVPGLTLTMLQGAAAFR